MNIFRSVIICGAHESILKLYSFIVLSVFKGSTNKLLQPISSRWRFTPKYDWFNIIVRQIYTHCNQHGLIQKLLKTSPNFISILQMVKINKQENFIYNGSFVKNFNYLGTSQS